MSSVTQVLDYRTRQVMDPMAVMGKTVGGDIIMLLGIILWDSLYKQMSTAEPP